MGRGTAPSIHAAGKVAPAAAIATTPITFVVGSVAPDSESLPNLQEFIASSKRAAEAVIKIIVVVTASRTNDEFQLALALAAHLKNILSGRAMEPSRITTRVIERGNLGSGTITLQLFRT